MRPQVTITTGKPAAACEGSAFAVQSTKQFAPTLNWQTINGSDGTIDNASADNINYTHGSGDRANAGAWLRVSTVAIPNEVCPQATDSIQIILHPYPAITMASRQQGCEPLSANFSGAESRGIPNGQLQWRWDFGNGDTSNLQNPTSILYNTQGRYRVNLRVTNSNGNCATTIDTADYVQVFPNPVAMFSTDPSFKTTVALPKFRTINQSSVTQAPFTPTMSYKWDFGTWYDPYDDTFTQFEPRYAYGKDTSTYYITLIVTSQPGGCSDTITRPVFVGPDIIVWIPDVFTPDGAGPGKNNTFNVTATNFKAFNIRIFNRWGEKMFETDNIDQGWDGNSGGKECMQGVYVYYVEVTSFEDKVYKFKGTITLLR
jgi:gliding motility-associated-like protein